jgi:integrase
MSNDHSTSPSRQGKPERPEGAVLFWHQSGRWCRKINGRFHYFGRGSYAEALAEYERRKADLQAGRLLHEAPEQLTLYWLAGKFLTAKLAKCDTGELTRRTLGHYQACCKLLLERFGRNRPVSDLRPHDFAELRRFMAAKWAPVVLGNMIQAVRTVFKWAYETRLVKEPVWFGPDFKKPRKKVMRLERAKKGPKLFTALEVRAMIDLARQPLRAMLLLAINCGFGNADCGRLPRSALDLEAGLIDFPRPKTGIPRRCPLWPQTVEALRQASALRPDAKDRADGGLVFLTQKGNAWLSDVAGGPIAHEFRKLLRRLGIEGRKGVGFYALRHTFRTVADGARDQPAADFLMGHESPHMSTHYREAISDERLQKVTEHVRAWLFSEPPGEGEEPVVLKIG